MLIVGIGGTDREASSSEAALRTALAASRDLGADTRCFAAEELELPLYAARSSERSPEAQALVDSLRAADGLIICSPGYHGTVSGRLKNALDYAEDLASDQSRPYLDGLPVGCISVAYGWQAAVNTLNTLRIIVHALRAWPTPYGAAINAKMGTFQNGECVDAGVEASLRLVAQQVVSFGRDAHSASPAGCAKAAERGVGGASP